MPELLCANSAYQHAGTTDVDVQVNLEIASGAVNVTRLEQALQNAGFVPEDGRIWRWVADGPFAETIVKFELLADLQDQQEGVTVLFDGCENLGAVNLRGTRYVTRDFKVLDLTARISGVTYNTQVNVAGLAGFLFAKVAAAYTRRMAKDWYDIAFVLLHNDAGGPAAATLARHRFADELPGLQTALDDLRANFCAPHNQGSRAYATQMRVDHPTLDPLTLGADAVLAVREFNQTLLRAPFGQDTR